MQDAAPWILLFDSIHHVIAAEDVFRAANVWCDLVPVPRDLSSNCGMALAFRGQELDTARRILADARIALRRVVRPASVEYVDETELFLNDD